MKKLILTGIVMFAIAGFAVQSDKVEASSIVEPQWAEFCPPLYENVVFKPAKPNSKRDMENNYWALRKAKFDKAVTECKVMSKSQSEMGACFQRVANLERNKSSQRKEARNEKYEDLNFQMRDGGYWWY